LLFGISAVLALGVVLVSRFAPGALHVILVVILASSEITDHGSYIRWRVFLLVDTQVFACKLVGKGFIRGDSFNLSPCR
jgi:hypothetical protein